MAMADERSNRRDVGSTATWHYPGEGETVVLIHGFRGDHHGLSAIAAAMPSLNVVIPDLPGYGHSPLLEGEHNLENYGRWLIEFLAELGGSPVVVGHSFGTLVVGSAIAQGLNPKSVVLLNPITLTASDTAPGRLAHSFYTLGKFGRLGSYLLRSALVVRGMSIAMATTKNLKLRSFIHNQHLTYFSNYRHDRVALEGFRAANSGNLMDWTELLPKGMLVIAGMKDIIAPIENQRLFAALVSARLEVLNVGHLTHYEIPLEVGELIVDYLTKP
jgi:pimeloyl-ACP methyl ester carboxylesterase